MSRGFGQIQRKIIEAFENSSKKKTEARTLMYYITDKIDSLDATSQILEASKIEIDNSTKTSIYETIINLQEKGIVEKKYMNVSRPQGSNESLNKRILIVKYNGVNKKK